MADKYIDIHTHHMADRPDVVSVRNIDPAKFASIVNIDNGYFSAGIHPWYIHPDTENRLAMLSAIASDAHVLAIGETGLDKLTDTDMDRQTSVFCRQIEIARKVKKPLIIHCVKAWNEVTRLLMEMKPEVPVIFHGFRGKPQLAADLLREGYYLSFGGLFNEESLKAAPLNRIFIETDDKNLLIEDVYRKVAEAKTVPVEILIENVSFNFRTCFSVQG